MEFESRQDFEAVTGLPADSTRPKVGRETTHEYVRLIVDRLIDRQEASLPLSGSDHAPNKDIGNHIKGFEGRSGS